MSKVVIAPPQDCSHSLKALSKEPLGRLSEYTRPFTIDSQYYLRCNNSFLLGNGIGVNSQGIAINETVPFASSVSKEAAFGGLLNQKESGSLAHISGAVCPLIDPRGWHNNYFHWLFDVLPRVFAAEHHQKETNDATYVLVPPVMLHWQAESLYRLNPANLKIISFTGEAASRPISCKTLLVRSSHRWQRSGKCPYDAMSPIDISYLHERLKLNAPSKTNQKWPKRILLSRSRAKTRRILNQFEVGEMLAKEGFEVVELDDLTFSEQVHLFSNVTHVIGSHGAGLANILHSRKCHVLEIFASGHGVRPDYFQLSLIKKLDYSFDVCKSLNTANDIAIDPGSIHEFLKRSL